MYKKILSKIPTEKQRIETTGGPFHQWHIAVAAAEIVFLVELYEIGQENISCKNRMKVEYVRGETQANRRKSHFCIEKSLLAKGTVGSSDSC